MSRRPLGPRAPRILATLALGVAAACGSSADKGPTTPTPPALPPMPTSGTAVPGLATVDLAITTLMAQYDIPGGALGIMKDGRLVYARGFGYSDVEAKTVATPEALFRIASVTKPVTKAAILKLVEQGRLSLDAPAFALMPDLTPLPGATVDPRLATITVNELLEHTAGWDRTVSFDPMFLSVQIANATGTPAPAGTEAIIRWMLGKPLDFTPGTKYAYSNFGYAVLGRIIERVSGKSYEQFVKDEILAPAGVTRMRLGRTLYAERLPGEVHYYDFSSGPSVFPGLGTVSLPYGAFDLDAMDSHGGWVASAIDLLRFEKTWITPPAQGAWAHDGAIPGTYAVMFSASNGVAWVALFNAREMSPNSQFQANALGTLQQAIGSISKWPTNDLFGSFP